jgi:hypothetical protein
LQGLPENRCPECGRIFDRERPETVNIGRPVGRIGKAALRPIGSPALILALIAAGLMFIVTTWPLGRPSLVELKYYAHPASWRALLDADHGWRDWVFVAGSIFTLTAGVIYLLRVTHLLAAFAIYRGYRPYRRRRYFQHSLISALVVSAMIGTFMGWPYRVGREWVAREAADPFAVPTGYVVTYSRFFPMPRIGSLVPLSSEQEVTALSAAARRMPTPPQRLTAVQMLVSHHPGSIAKAMPKIVPGETDAAVCATELHVMAVTRDDRASELFEQMLADSRPQVRAAAADGLAVRYSSAFQLDDYVKDIRSRSWSTPPADPHLIGDLPINLGALAAAIPPPVAATARQREALEEMMLSGKCSEEREAAARAMVSCPPDGYRLRVAEWGVWISEKGQLKLEQSVLDEIPPFVHQTGNSMSSFSHRVSQMMDVTKPIIHVTVDAPMAVDLAVLMRSGRPWYAYPRPDDFSVSVDQFQMELSGKEATESEPLMELENKTRASLPDVSEGFPWMTPHHRTFGSTGGAGNPYNAIDSLGVRWQSLIVSPQELPWMLPPDCGTDKRYAWWKALRQVPSSWVSSRGEADRFLYYDGPTLASPPAVITLNNNFVQIQGLGVPDDGPRSRRSKSLKPMKQQTLRDYSRREGLYIEVVNGRASAKRLRIAGVVASINLAGQVAYMGIAAEDCFREMLVQAGLTDPEAGGMVTSWKHQFFETEGKRFLLLMSAADYDSLCPIEIKPPPTQVVRVGIVLTEFP